MHNFHNYKESLSITWGSVYEYCKKDAESSWVQGICPLKIFGKVIRLFSTFLYKLIIEVVFGDAANREGR